MYKLYYYPRNASWVPHIFLEEMGVDYELVLVDRKSKAQKSAEYMRLNPAGRIPTLVHKDVVVFESAAICLYLCEQNPQAGLIPDVTDPLRAKFYQWLFYLNASLQPELMLYFYPAEHTTVLNCTAAIAEAQESRITEMFSLLNAELEGKTFLVGDYMTVCDYYLFMLSHWASDFKKPPLSFPSLGPYLCQLAKRQAMINVCEAEGTSLAMYDSAVQKT
ncbi:glutathione S-transferase family protein [Iodobacter fluviatilis]|uniref:Glutathione S-transferase n=1 Tax=Iodobacter fluviatilis TaxID=537 RepID=A0A377Q9V5_9NEIS|nr:glutathione S-transferase family protein [Iodobacter fluviatilis]TCU88570.1 glutathione S-transferase [Iodobacter fluviatilis]STQ91359.1 Glutathione S-transferase GST-4.5 [Iodobacter fluviatilis]